MGFNSGFKGLILIYCLNDNRNDNLLTVRNRYSKPLPMTNLMHKFLIYLLQSSQRLETAQMKFLRHLLGITKLDKEKYQCIRGKNGSTECSKGNETVPGKVATTRTEDGHK